LRDDKPLLKKTRPAPRSESNCPFERPGSCIWRAPKPNAGCPISSSAGAAGAGLLSLEGACLARSASAADRRPMWPCSMSSGWATSRSGFPNRTIAQIGSMCPIFNMPRASSFARADRNRGKFVAQGNSPTGPPRPGVRSPKPTRVARRALRRCSRRWTVGGKSGRQASSSI